MAGIGRALLHWGSPARPLAGAEAGNRPRREAASRPPPGYLLSPQWRPHSEVVVTPSLLLRMGHSCPHIRLLRHRIRGLSPVSYTHLRAHETDSYLVCR